MMTDWLRRARGAFRMGIGWAVVWGPLAVVIGLIVDPDGSTDEMWVAIGAYPGFLCGAVSAALLGIGAGRRNIAEVAPLRAGACGAAAGLLVGALPFALGDPISELPLWQLGGAVIGSVTLASAVSAVAAARFSAYRARGRLSPARPRG